MKVNGNRKKVCIVFLDILDVNIGEYNIVSGIGCKLTVSDCPVWCSILELIEINVLKVQKDDWGHLHLSGFSTVSGFKLGLSCG